MCSWLSLRAAPDRGSALPVLSLIDSLALPFRGPALAARIGRPSANSFSPRVQEPAMADHPPLPPFSRETAAQKVQAAEDAWNTRDPQRVSLAYSEDSV